MKLNIGGGTVIEFDPNDLSNQELIDNLKELDKEIQRRELANIVDNDSWDSWEE